jgi:D-beta-D-heptose 7-phosphate kinase/D-beta-D-heptose 1-phosphate adenosyltransferase
MLRIAVCGDSVVDEFVYSKSRRLSPEAPVAIADYLYTTATPGGAANVVMNSAAAGSKSILISRIGNSIRAKDLIENWLSKECEVIDFDPRDFEIPIKTRYIVDGFQTVRIDQEAIKNLEWSDAIIEKYENLTKDCDYIIVSDYGKGFYNLLDALPASTLEKSIVDPYGTNWDKYRGCFVLKPNIAELENFIGTTVTKENLAAAAAQVMKCIQPNYLVVTLGANGVMWTSDGSELNFYKETPRAVADVSGAGDTFAAFFAMALSAGKKIEYAIKTASKAAGLAVERTGTSIIYSHELHLEDKIISNSDLMIRNRIWKRDNKKIVFTNGCFDIIHAGHVSLFNAAKKMGDILIVGINSDESVKRLKGNGRPLNNVVDRVAVLQAIDVVDHIIIFGDGETENDSPLDLIKSLLPDVLVKGGDYSEEQIVGSTLVKSNGGKIYIHKTLEGLSTTAILQKGQYENR